LEGIKTCLFLLILRHRLGHFAKANSSCCELTRTVIGVLASLYRCRFPNGRRSWRGRQVFLPAGAA
jgi:hypothetical protein